MKVCFEVEKKRVWMWERMKVAFESWEMAWERAGKVVVSVYNLWVKESWETVGVVGKYLIGTRIYQIWVPLKCNSSFLDSGSKWVKIIHEELEFSKLEFHVFFLLLLLIQVRRLPKRKSNLGNSILGWNSSLTN